MLKKIAPVLTSLPHLKKQILCCLIGLIVVLGACVQQESSETIQVSCDTLSAQIENNPDIGRLDIDTIQSDAILVHATNISTKFNQTIDTYSWDLQSNELQQLVEPERRYPLPCDCEAKVIDESPDGKWQIIDTRVALSEGKYRTPRWLIGADGYLELRDGIDWVWSDDGLYFSYIWATQGPIGKLELISLDNLETIWQSSTEFEVLGDVPNDFLIPWPLSHHIVFSPVSKLYYYRTWFESDNNTLYVYDPIEKKGWVDHVENIKTVTWNQAFGQLFYVLSDGETLTVRAEDGSISATLPYSLFLEVLGAIPDAELTHTSFYLSPDLSHLIVDSHGGLIGFGCAFSD